MRDEGTYDDALVVYDHNLGMNVQQLRNETIQLFLLSSQPRLLSQARTILKQMLRNRIRNFLVPSQAPRTALELLDNLPRFFFTLRKGDLLDFRLRFVTYEHAFACRTRFLNRDFFDGLLVRGAVADPETRKSDLSLVEGDAAVSFHLAYEGC